MNDIPIPTQFYLKSDILRALGVQSSRFDGWVARGCLDLPKPGTGSLRPLQFDHVVAIAVLAVATEIGVRTSLAAKLARVAAAHPETKLLHVSGDAIWFDGERRPDRAAPGGQITLELQPIIQLAVGAMR